MKKSDGPPDVIVLKLERRVATNDIVQATPKRRSTDSKDTMTISVNHRVKVKRDSIVGPVRKYDKKTKAP